jgi:hypothetical protein
MSRTCIKLWIVMCKSQLFVLSSKRRLRICRRSLTDWSKSARSRMIGWINYVRNWPNRETCLFPVGPFVVSVLLNFRTCVWIRIVPVWKVGIVLKMYPLQLYHTQIGKAKKWQSETQTLLHFLRLPWQIVNQLLWGQRFYYLSSTIYRPNFPASLTPKSPFSLHALYQTYDTV